MKQNVLDGIANRATRIAGLGVDADLAHVLFHRLRGRIDINVAVAREMLENRNRRFFHDGSNQPLAAARDDDVDVVVELQERRQERAVGGFDELHGGRINFHLRERFGDNGRDGRVGVHGLFSAAKDDGVAGFEAESGGVAGDVGPAFVDEKHNPQRHAHFFHAQAIGPDVAFQDLPDRVHL